MRNSGKILILGGTSEARAIAGQLDELGADVTSSLAGVTSHPQQPVGKVRVGGFGGVDGLVRYLTSNSIRVLIDATHPFAVQMSRHSALAAALVPVVLHRLERAPWKPEDNENWTEVANMAAAVAALPKNAHVFLAIGRKEFAPFTVRSDLTGVIRMIEAPGGVLENAQNWNVVLERPLPSVEDEVAVLRAHAVSHLVCKNAGGPARHKLAAAHLLGIQVVIVERSQKQPLALPHQVHAEVDQLLAAVKMSLSPESSR
jgi:precorrin-6A/cobalt-precorrin-6A reductase